MLQVLKYQLTFERQERWLSARRGVAPTMLHDQDPNWWWRRWVQALRILVTS